MSGHADRDADPGPGAEGSEAAPAGVVADEALAPEVAEVAEAHPATREEAKLREAERAYAAGNHQRVRARARDLVKAQDPAVREAARTLLRRVSIDPVNVAVLGVSAAVLLWIAVSYLG
ncbi:MAG: hypothetical protein ACFCGT_00655 [Sandaracinaceae bacterium]